MRREPRFVLPCVGGRSGTDDRIPATGDSAGRGDFSYGAVGGAAADFPHRIAAVLRLAIKRTFREALQVRVRMFGGAAAAVAVGSVPCGAAGGANVRCGGAPASDRSVHSVTAGSRTGSVGGALNRIAFGLRRSGKIPFGMLPSDRVQAGNPFGDRRCGKIPPPLSRKRTVSINRAQSRTGVRALPRRERRPWKNERSLLVASHRRPRLRMRVAPKGICRTVPPRSRKGAGRPRRRGLDWDLRSCSGTENGPGCECGEKGGNL